MKYSEIRPCEIKFLRFDIAFDIPFAQIMLVNRHKTYMTHLNPSK